MAANPETMLTKRIVALLEQFGCWCVKIHGSQYQMAGLPDLLVMRGGRVAWLEIKTATGKTSRVQDVVIAKIKRYGVPVAVVRTPEEALEFVSDHLPTAGGADG